MKYLILTIALLGTLSIGGCASTSELVIEGDQSFVGFGRLVSGDHGHYFTDLTTDFEPDMRVTKVYTGTWVNLASKQPLFDTDIVCNTRDRKDWNLSCKSLNLSEFKEYQILSSSTLINTLSVVAAPFTFFSSLMFIRAEYGFNMSAYNRAYEQAMDDDVMASMVAMGKSHKAEAIAAKKAKELERDRLRSIRQVNESARVALRHRQEEYVAELVKVTGAQEYFTSGTTMNKLVAAVTKGEPAVGMVMIEDVYKITQPIDGGYLLQGGDIPVMVMTDKRLHQGYSIASKLNVLKYVDTIQYQTIFGGTSQAIVFAETSIDTIYPSR